MSRPRRGSLPLFQCLDHQRSQILLTTYIALQVDLNMDPKHQIEHIESTATCEGMLFFFFFFSNSTISGAVHG